MPAVPHYPLHDTDVDPPLAACADSGCSLCAADAEEPATPRQAAEPRAGCLPRPARCRYP